MNYLLVCTRMLSLEKKMKIFALALAINNIKSFVQMRILQVDFRRKILKFYLKELPNAFKYLSYTITEKLM